LRRQGRRTQGNARERTTHRYTNSLRYAHQAQNESSPRARHSRTATIRSALFELRHQAPATRGRTSSTAILKEGAAKVTDPPVAFASGCECQKLFKLPC